MENEDDVQRVKNALLIKGTSATSANFIRWSCFACFHVCYSSRALIPKCLHGKKKLLPFPSELKHII